MGQILVLAAAIGLSLLAGAGIGYAIGHARSKRAAARASGLEKKLDEYRRDVTDHFARTAEHFDAIGHQYRALYEHMASGAETLCEKEQLGRRLSFEPRDILAPIAEELAGELGEERDAGAPRDFVESGELEDIDEVPAAPVPEEKLGPAGEKEKRSGDRDDAESKTETKSDAGKDAASRTYH